MKKSYVSACLLLYLFVHTSSCSKQVQESSVDLSGNFQINIAHSYSYMVAGDTSHHPPIETVVNVIDHYQVMGTIRTITKNKVEVTWGNDSIGFWSYNPSSNQFEKQTKTELEYDDQLVLSDIKGEFSFYANQKYLTKDSFGFALGSFAESWMIKGKRIY